ncbi:VanZ family protein [Streptomyces montanisoli]|uniref:VanZ family protein n=1 Tax=Streptomyces montanisoli TaxID=2798581 RepID=A0A940RV68_9ACTN|nr:VanZ family protein [Streptomyces montanisoli]MBP0457956.1 VanZ family protein [Streptomyces montanisoli]
MRLGSGGSAAIRLRAVGALLLFVHLLAVAWLTLRPVDAPWVTAANLRPFAGIRADFALGAVHGIRSLVEGLALLAPAGVLLPVVSGRLWVSPWASLARTAGAGLLISLTIELLQTGVPGRVLDVDSLILNTLGVALAHALIVPAGRAGIRRRLRASASARVAAADGRVAPRGDVYDPDAVPEGETPEGHTPTIPRVGIAP